MNDSKKLLPDFDQVMADGGCDKCDGAGSAFTYSNQACMAINGRVRSIDWCIHQIVAALNAGGVETVACCCGHGDPGRIDLADGRVLVVVKNEDVANKLAGWGKGDGK